jgi:hypothetical protein
VLLRFGAQMAGLRSLASTIETITSDIRELLRRYPLPNEVLAQEINARLAALTALANEH